MNLALACIPIAFLLIYAAKIPLAWAMHQQGKSEGKAYDNRHPRDQQAKLTGWGKRAVAAHYNGFETFPAFAVGVLVAFVTHADEQHTQLLAVVFVVSRAAYTAFYLADVHWLRSSFWAVGFGCILALYVRPFLG